MNTNQKLFGALSATAKSLPESGIVEVMNYGRRREGTIALWAGEGDLPTPDFISEAAARSLKSGETFYTWQRGIPELREQLALYHHKLYGVPADRERYFVCGSGMQAIQIAFALTMVAGDEVIIPSPSWPNAAAAAQVIGAKPAFVAMDFGDRGFSLDLSKIESLVGPRTRVIFLNSPANPSGWVATPEDLKNVLALARKHGLWIVADEIYARFNWKGGERSPSFRDVMDPEDRIVFVNTFSKNWAMTGWRIGWIEAHPSLGQAIENLIQYSTSGVAVFMQRAGIAALDKGENFVKHMIERSRKGREITMNVLGKSNRVRLAPPDGAFYAFFSVEGESDSRALALKLIDEAGVGLAPGTAFGPGAEPFLRICFARSPESLEIAVNRIADWLKR
ncbi:MAG: pyridoxal phosphate-dependent aminotransferase [Xanthobacteraceae bacterium]|nr:pyridoxal phosphate-dependent aminotransferase [Xanthobacteraceae bacterium]MBX3535624.1 pyridoxal phosphate-dependent aminotransferase [Xanthobacteraceae bacterium]MBX3549194.1 pyridoxal phosphate-dependent aminotransferase [Xanthobacteraceae bacterium]MCW5673664.1 pyridoxal phosphate-dependent aminotransferase [Xanthobacteraceae bacterium]MCW5678402.1 pyridoxal phosphate-dependent aminotransferase [Xanthobacteraceae bacterium]